MSRVLNRRNKINNESLENILILVIGGWAGAVGLFCNSVSHVYQKKGVLKCVPLTEQHVSFYEMVLLIKIYSLHELRTAEVIFDPISAE